MAENGTRNAKLTRAQKRAIPALVAERTIGDAARAARVGSRTIHRWLATDDHFRRALSDAQQVAVSDATRRLAQLAGVAVGTLEGVMVDPNASHTAALRSADLVLSHWLKMRQLAEFEQRLSALEELFGL